MWWDDVSDIAAGLNQAQVAGAEAAIDIHWTAIIDESAGPVSIGRGSRICAGAYLAGPIHIGEDCLVGNMTMLRGPISIGDRVLIGFATEVKQALIGNDVSIGPQCFVADSRVDDHAYLGAQVRTSNQRLDRATVWVMHGAERHDSRRDKLGCWIGAGAALGIQCIVLPGRVVAADSVFEPRITIKRNYPTGHYRSSATVEDVMERRNAA